LKSTDWSFKVANPRAVGEAEKEHWARVEPLLTAVVDELWNADKIETVFEETERASLVSAIRKADDLGAVYNTLLHLSDSPENAANFENAAEKFGFDESKIVANYVFVTFALVLLKVELFKLVLLFHLKDIDSFSVADFIRTIAKAAPGSWPKLKPFVDSPLRNALAHGTYAIVNKKIALYEDAKLDLVEELDLGSFIVRAKKQDVVLFCLINVLREKGLFALGG
jgi:hypothetical protein